MVFPYCILLCSSEQIPALIVCTTKLKFFHQASEDIARCIYSEMISPRLLAISQPLEQKFLLGGTVPMQIGWQLKTYGKLGWSIEYGQ